MSFLSQSAMLYLTYPAYSWKPRKLAFAYPAMRLGANVDLALKLICKKFSYIL